MKYIFSAVAMACMIAFTGCSEKKKNSMAEYLPVERNIQGNKIVLSAKPEWRTPEHLQRVQEVFDAYHVDYKYQDGKLMINKDLQRNWQSLSNYSMKANDPDWKKKDAAEKKRRNAPAAPQGNGGWSIQTGK